MYRYGFEHYLILDHSRISQGPKSQHSVGIIQLSGCSLKTSWGVDNDFNIAHRIPEESEDVFFDYINCWE